MNLGLDGARVFVAGASRGIGFAIAREFLEEGAHVALVARGEDGLERASRSLTEEFPQRTVSSIAADMCKEDEVGRAIDRAQAELGGIDFAIANVGTGAGSNELLPELGEWQRLLDLNLISAVLLCQ